MEKLRKPFQGVTNIILFNWHFYVLSFFVLIGIYFSFSFFPQFYFLFFVLFWGLIWSILVSLIVSCYVYDFSGLYNFDQLQLNPSAQSIVNIHAGFDETSSILKQKFSNVDLTVLDFYDPVLHTEISIQRARNAYPSYPNTLPVKFNSLPLVDESVDAVFLVFAAHEIRNKKEKIIFFEELYRILKPDGVIYIVEHLRDFPNFCAYNIGFFHFFSEKSWKLVFEATSFNLIRQQKQTPFVTIFKLSKNATSL